MSPHKCGHKSNRLVGWTYEANEEAISQAQENLDELDTQKRQEDLQYQIDIQERLKEIVENFEAEREIEQSIKNLEDWLKANGEYTSMSGMVSAIVEGFGKQTITVNFAEDGDNQEKTEAEKWEDAKGEVEKAKGEVETAANNIKADKHTDTENYNLQVTKYNDALLKLDAALKTAAGFAQYEEANFKEAIKLNKSEPKKEFEKKFIEINDPNVSDLGSINLSAYEDFSVGGFEVQANLDDYDSSKNDEIIKKIGNPSSGRVVYSSGEQKAYIGIKVGGPQKWSHGIESDYVWLPISGKNASSLVANYELQNFAKGTESFQGGQTLINELGTEAVITPGGTLTALPSKTGIVPADITRNVWALGEVAPTLVAQLNSLTQKPVAGNVGNTTYEEGQYFDHFTMNVYPAKGDDLDKILQQARAHVALTRHNN